MAELSPGDWVRRCAKRISDVDPGISAVEAGEIAGSAVLVERLRAMAPEAAVEFVLAQIARPNQTRYERRTAPR